MKILLVSNGYPPKEKGGVEQYVHSIAHKLKKSNEIYVFTREYNQGKKNFANYIFEEGNLTVRSIVNNNVFPQNFVNSYINNKIDEIFEETIKVFKPDVIHFNHLLALSSNLPKVAKKYKVPMLFTLHDYWYICPCIKLITSSGDICSGSNLVCVRDYFQQSPPFLSMLFEKSPLIFRKLIPTPLLSEIRSVFANTKIINKKRSLNNSRFSKLVKLREKHFKKILSNSSAYIVPSKYVREKYIDFGIDARKIILLPHGIDLKRIKQNLHKQKNKKIIFAYLGTFLELKGIHILIEAFNMLDRKNIELKIYGDTKTNPFYYRKLKRISDKGNIYFMGGYNHSDLGRILSSVDVVIIPSLSPESFNLVAHEAQAARVPVIASKIGALIEVVDGNNGLLFNPGDVKGLAKMMNIVIGNPKLISTFSSNSKIPLSIESHVLKLVNIYKTLVKNTT